MIYFLLIVLLTGCTPIPIVTQCHPKTDKNVSYCTDIYHDHAYDRRY